MAAPTPTPHHPRCAFFGLLLATTSLHAGVLLQESFDYTSLGDTASLSGLGQNTSSITSGTGWSGNWGANSKYESTGLVSSQLTGELGGAANVTANSNFTRTFSATTIPGPSTAANGTTYWGVFLFSFDQGENPTGSRVMLWSTGSTAGVGVEFTRIGTTSTFDVKAAFGNGTTSPTFSSTASSAVNRDTTNLVVFRATFNSTDPDEFSIWLNPADVSSIAALGTATSSVSGTFTTGGTAGIYLRTNGTTNDWTFDEFTLGNSFSDLPFTAVPEPASTAVIAGALVLGAIAYRRRRTA